MYGIEHRPPPLDASSKIGLKIGAKINLIDLGTGKVNSGIEPAGRFGQ